MGKDDKEDSGFGFKDRAKAEDTLRLLEEHPMNYRRLTVRGLLGRAKRVLSMTKAEDKIKNIKEAMAVFEDWLAELDKNKEQKTDKKPDKKKEEKKEEKKQKEKEDKNGDDKDSGSSSDVSMEEEEPPEKKQASDAGPALGFKDKAAAEAALQQLEGRDPSYQQLAVKGLIGRAKRVLTCTRDETKLSNIKEAMAIFEKFLDDFDTQHLSRQNNPYLSLGLVRTAEKLAESVTDQQKSFIAAYASVGGDYKRLRSVASDGGKTWDIVRNTALKDLKEKHAEAKLFNSKDEPTPEHLELMLWAYSPEQAKVKKCVKETQEEKSRSGDRKRRSSAADEGEGKRKKSD